MDKASGTFPCYLLDKLLVEPRLLSLKQWEFESGSWKRCKIVMNSKFLLKHQHTTTTSSIQSRRHPLLEAPQCLSFSGAAVCSPLLIQHRCETPWRHQAGDAAQMNIHLERILPLPLAKQLCSLPPQCCNKLVRRMTETKLIFLLY